jgi:hypothetical protein
VHKIQKSANKNRIFIKTNCREGRKIKFNGKLDGRGGYIESCSALDIRVWKRGYCITESVDSEFKNKGYFI